MRYDVRYRCIFTYDQPAAESHNELRACPSTGGDQTVLHARVVTTPSARVLTTTDYWGTRVDAFGIRAPHERLEVSAEARVEVGERPVAPAGVPVAALAEAPFTEEHRELLAPSPLVTPDAAVSALAASVAPDPTGVTELATALCMAVEERVEHVTGVTEVGTTVGEVLANGSGVCQDRAHVLVALCRARGIPARYVSGFLCAGPTGAGTTTHAWVEVAVPDHGWHLLDPSDDHVAQQHRIVIGRGRDYGDVPPLRGTYVGGDARALEVAVDINHVTPVS